MKCLRFGAFLCLLFGFGLRVEGQEFFARNLYAGAERNTIIAGEQIQFWAFALGWTGQSAPTDSTGDLRMKTWQRSLRPDLSRAPESGQPRFGPRSAADGPN